MKERIRNEERKKESKHRIECGVAEGFNFFCTHLEMSVTIDDVTLNYKTNGNKYITSFISEYPPELDTRIDQVFNRIFPLYNSRYLEYSNVCGPNSEYICKKVKLDGITFGNNYK